MSEEAEWMPSDAQIDRLMQDMARQSNRRRLRFRWRWSFVTYRKQGLAVWWTFHHDPEPGWEDRFR